MAYTKPDEEFAAFMAEGRFMLQRECGTDRCFHYPRSIAPGSAAIALEWIEASGKGTVYATTVVRCRPPEPHYNVMLVDLDEGPRLMSRVNSVPPEDVRIGMRVQAEIVSADGGPILVFRPQS